MADQMLAWLFADNHDLVKESLKWWGKQCDEDVLFKKTLAEHGKTIEEVEKALFDSKSKAILGKIPIEAMGTAQ